MVVILPLNHMTLLMICLLQKYLGNLLLLNVQLQKFLIFFNLLSMQHLSISVSYQFDGNKAWSESYTDHAKHSRITVDEKRFHKSLIEAIAIVDGHMEFNKTQSPQPIYRDRSDGTSYQVGWIYRCSTECDGKIFRWDAWVTINGIITPYPFPESTF